MLFRPLPLQQSLPQSLPLLRKCKLARDRFAIFNVSVDRGSAVGIGVSIVVVAVL